MLQFPIPTCNICGCKLVRTKLEGKWKCKECNYYLEKQLIEEIQDLKFSVVQIKSILAALVIDDNNKAKEMFEKKLCRRPQ